MKVTPYKICAHKFSVKGAYEWAKVLDCQIKVGYFLTVIEETDIDTNRKYGIIYIWNNKEVIGYVREP